MNPRRSHDPNEAPRREPNDEEFVPGPLDDPSEAHDSDESIDDPDDEDENDDGDIEDSDVEDILD
jgi:hypothetical protein